jgi:Acyl-protein synthetase, LuxE
MTSELSNFAARLRESICSGFQNEGFDALTLELFGVQFKHNAAYRKICEARGLTPKAVEHWTQIPVVPTAAFKELELTSLAPEERTTVFHSSGTTEQNPSRHFHNAGSLALYEVSLWEWFEQNIFADSKFKIPNSKLICLTPPPAQAPHSSLVYMFEIVRRKLGGASVPASQAEFLGKLATDGSWTLDFDATLETLSDNLKLKTQNPKLILGTAFSFVHLLDFLDEQNLSFQLPSGSRVLETGGYKNRSRSLPKPELHALITERLGIPQENIICEYGMSELSSQAYDSINHHPSSIIHHRVFRFPPWARVQIISPETGREVANGETGLIRIFDLANVFSVAAIQTEDLGVRRGPGFELIGRAQLAEPRGCSLMTA